MSNASDFVIENGVLTKYVGPGGDVVIPEGVTSIGTNAFSKCISLTSIQNPQSVTSIGRGSFSWCTALRSIEIPASIMSLGRYAFMDCSSLRSIRLLGKGVAIEEDAFFGLAEHAGIIAPNIPFEVFTAADVKRAAALGFLKESERYTDFTIAAAHQKYALAQKKKLLPIVFREDIWQAVAIYAANKKITAANFEPEYMEPAQNAKAVACIAYLLEWKHGSGSPKAKEKQPDQELTKDPFNGADMKKLWGVENLADGTLAISSYKGAETEIPIPERIGKKTVTRLEDHLFSTETKDGRSRPKKQVEILRAIRTIHIPGGVTAIGRNAFSGCGSLSRVDIPASVTSIGDEAFRGCESLKDENGFVIIRNTVYDYYGPGGDIRIPADVTGIGASAFEKKGDLTSVVIPVGVTSIGKYAFNWCTNLSGLALPDSVSSIGRYAFLRCDGLSNIRIPGNVASIEECAFMGCRGLANVELSDGTTSIGDSAFNGCENLTSIKIPSSVTSMAVNAFFGCKKLYIHAPAGSYAETYAKEHNIPFVAE